MSVEFTTPSDVSFASDDVDVPAPEEVFEALLADPGRCCQQCYRRLRARRRFPRSPGEQYGEMLSFVERILPEGHDWSLLDVEYWQTDLEADRTERVHPPGDEPAESRGACRFCGAVEPHRSPSTRSRAQALEASIGISATLTEHGIPHNQLVLAVEIADLKQDPDYAGDDFGTFSLASERAIRAAGGR